MNTDDANRDVEKVYSQILGESQLYIKEGVPPSIVSQSIIQVGLDMLFHHAPSPVAAMIIINGMTLAKLEHDLNKNDTNPN